MGKIVISTNTSLDGVVQDPDGAEGFRLGGWFGRYGGADLEASGKVMYDEALGTDACCWGGAATSTSAHGGRPGAGSGPIV